ncbi:Hypothetical Protein FCC1311_009412 [Hondaea fermentalgiana]|uniref:DUF5880 domain-containing protein n=1 Tax=Hondaea fermentalgiana TaxID=2315210 RepID=A0A2R5G8B6_9STRA|nr:Hypothetical Protein FCC1311_009412 [Hondaea fermentalgiana]|eukprot:GBG24723.1 Hypothetical Protein FCC1311_009412 [Hondaea fermentalgiana]
MEAIVGLMTKVGPIVQTVLMTEAGEFEEITMDMTPAKDEITKRLQGRATFLGKFREQNVVLMTVRDPVEDLHKVNAGKLPYPFNELPEAVRGAVLLVKMGDDAEPETFTLKDFETLSATQKEKLEKGINEDAVEDAGDDAEVAQEEEDDEEEDDEDFDGEGDEDDDDDEDEDEDDDGDEDEENDDDDEDEKDENEEDEDKAVDDAEEASDEKPVEADSSEADNATKRKPEVDAAPDSAKKAKTSAPTEA